MNIKIYANVHLIFVNSGDKYWPMFCMAVIRKDVLLTLFHLALFCMSILVQALT